MPRDPDSDHKHPSVSTPPPRRSLDEGSDHTSLTSSARHKDRPRDALRAWFHSDAFNARDGLDDYDQDYHNFHPLKDIITADMRHYIDRCKQGDRNEQESRKANFASADSGVASESSAEATERKGRIPKPADTEMVFPYTESSTLKLRSSGRLAIIGSEDRVRECALRLGERLKCILLVDSEEQNGCSQTAVSDRMTLPLIRGKIAGLSGFLGKFTVSVRIDGEIHPITSLLNLDGEAVDLVLDLDSPPHIRCERLPLGYFAPGNDSEMLDHIMNELPDMVGEFEKPVFIFEVPELCGHHRSRFRGCERCIRSCPADAIRTKGDAVEINHHLCQGCGLCAAVCPTGALANGHLQSDKLLIQIKGELQKLQSDGNSASWIVFHGSDTDPELLNKIQSESSAPSIRMPVDEIGSIGMDIWFAALAYGAKRVILVPSPQTTPGMRRTIGIQIGYAGSILQGMGYPAERVILTDGLSPQMESAADFGMRANQIPDLPAKAATFSPMPDRRRLMRCAIEHLYDQSPRSRPSISLPSGAPFGTIRIDKDACTFCMACAQVCPTSALGGGSDQPQLNLIEDRCIQCGLCRRACPEKAIALDPRFVYERKISEKQQVLNREASFNCICCGKPFAAARLVERMEARLAGHWMYRSPEERRRLKMCRDCRLQDIFGSQPLEEIR